MILGRLAVRKFEQQVYSFIWIQMLFDRKLSREKRLFRLSLAQVEDCIWWDAMWRSPCGLLFPPVYLLSNCRLKFQLLNFGVLTWVCSFTFFSSLFLHLWCLFCCTSFLSILPSDILLDMTAENEPTYSFWTAVLHYTSLGTSWSSWI